MDEFNKKLPVRLSTGGLFYRILLRLHLVEENQYHPWRRIVLFTGLTWLPLLILSAIEGTLVNGGTGIAFLRDPVPHVRYLIALPLLVIADWFIDPYVANIVRHFQISGLVPDDAKPAYRNAVERLIRQRDAAWVDIVILGLSIGLVWLLTQLGISSFDSQSSSWMLTQSRETGSLTPAGWWFLIVSIPFILFVLSRWIWRLIIWIGFMNAVSSLPLTIEPTHPDRVGGLGLLTGAQFSFGVLFTAIGAMMSSALASDILYTERTLSEVQLQVATYVLICFAIIAGPLFTFSNQLINAKRRELRHYSELGFQLADTFHTKWIINEKGKQRGKIINAVDPSAMCDYSDVYETISAMHLIPLTRQKIILLLLLLLAPFLPLIFTQISIKEALQQLAQTLV